MKGLLLGLVMIGGGGLLGIILKWYFFDPIDREFQDAVKQCFDQQALKHKGTVKISGGWPALSIPHKTATIELSVSSSNDETSQDYACAGLRTEACADKKFGIYLDRKSFLYMPVVIGQRFELADERFNEKYIVSGNDFSFVNRLLSPDFRDTLLKLDCFDSVTYKRGWLSINVRSVVTNDEAYDEMIGTAILFYENLAALSLVSA